MRRAEGKHIHGGPAIGFPLKGKNQPGAPGSSPAKLRDCQTTLELQHPLGTRFHEQYLKAQKPQAVVPTVDMQVVLSPPETTGLGSLSRTSASIGLSTRLAFR